MFDTLYQAYVTRGMDNMLNFECRVYYQCFSGTFVAKRQTIKYILIFVLVYTGSVFASSPVMLNEINHLLAYVKQTNCQFQRNGKSYNGKEAVEHIKNKYDYYIDDIDSTEKFIELSATKSMMSGKYYMIVCKDRKSLKSREWLLQELRKYRNKLPEQVGAR